MGRRGAKRPHLSISSCTLGVYCSSTVRRRCELDFSLGESQIEDGEIVAARLGAERHRGRPGGRRDVIGGVTWVVT